MMVQQVGGDKCSAATAGNACPRFAPYVTFYTVYHMCCRIALGMGDPYSQLVCNFAPYSPAITHTAQDSAVIVMSFLFIQRDGDGGPEVNGVALYSPGTNGNHSGRKCCCPANADASI